jgi:hypothetical protein
MHYRKRKMYKDILEVQDTLPRAFCLDLLEEVEALKKFIHDAWMVLEMLDVDFPGDRDGAWERVDELRMELYAETDTCSYEEERS